MTQASPLTTIEPQEGVSLIFNPSAAGNRRRGQPLLNKLNAVTGVRMYVTESLDDLQRAADQIAGHGAGCLAIGGGDGTISHTLSALRERLAVLPRIALLRGGSMNMVANSIGAGKDPVATVTALANGVTCREVWRNTMDVGGRLGFIFGLGLVTNFLEAYYSGTYTGPRRAALVVMQTIGSTLLRGQLSKRVFRRCRGSLHICGRAEIRDWTVILAETIENLGIGFKPAYRALEQLGKFHVLGGDISPASFVGHLSYVYKGRPWPKELHMLDELANRMRFESLEPFLYTVDGELLQAEHSLNVHVVEPTRFLIPTV